MNCIYVEPLQPRRLLAAGDLDLTFGAAGIFHEPAPDRITVNDSLVTPDGKIVIAGEIDLLEETGDGDYLLRRYNADGTADTSFGGDGTATGRLGGAPVLIRRIEAAPDGKIVAVGRDGSEPTDFPMPGFVMRFNADGSLDTTFSDDGFDTVTLEGGEAVNVAVQSDGSVLFIHEKSLKRYTPDGDLDATFGDNGTFTSEAFVSSVLAQADGKLIVGLTFPDTPVEERFVLTRLDSDGSTDASFGDNGRAALSYYPGNLVPLAGGGFLVTGEKPDYTAGIRQAVRRYDGNGNLDTTFGDNGERVVIQAGTTQRTFVDDAGRIYLTSFTAGAARLTPHGDFDSTFGRVVTFGSSFIGFPAGIVEDRLLFGGAFFDFSPHRKADYALIARVIEDDGIPSRITVSNRTLTITGSDKDDEIIVENIHFLRASLDGFGRLFDSDEVDLVSITGGDGNDRIFSDSGPIPSHVKGGNGRDKIAAGSGNDTLEGNAQRDFIDGGGGDDLIVGNGGPDQLNGQAGNDSLGGGAGNDYLHGDIGNDHLEGGAGNDRLRGNEGNDTFDAIDGFIDQLFGDDGSDSADADENDVLDSIETVG